MNDLLNVIAEAEEARKRLERSLRKIARNARSEDTAVMNRELPVMRWHLIEARHIAEQTR